MIAKALLLAVLAVAAIQPASAAQRCFSVTQMNGWKSADGKTITIRAGTRYYRLDLARQCSTLKSVNPQLLLTNREGPQICSALDLDVKASESPGGIVEPCFPKTLTALSDAEAAALPKDQKP